VSKWSTILATAFPGSDARNSNLFFRKLNASTLENYLNKREKCNPGGEIGRCLQSSYSRELTVRPSDEAKKCMESHNLSPPYALKGLGLIKHKVQFTFNSLQRYFEDYVYVREIFVF